MAALWKCDQERRTIITFTDELLLQNHTPTLHFIELVPFSGAADHSQVLRKFFVSSSASSQAKLAIGTIKTNFNVRHHLGLRVEEDQLDVQTWSRNRNLSYGRK